MRPAAALGVAAIGLGLVEGAHAAADRPAEDAVVTVAYLEAPPMDTPAAVSEVTGADAANRGIEDIEDLFKAVPGLNFMTTAPTYNLIAMRGVAPVAGGPATVGVYRDAVPIGSSRGQYGHLPGALFDIERIEVLKGPRGTLHGEGAMGGVIRYVTRAPDPDAFAASAGASAETTNHSLGFGGRAEAMLNVPLGERSAVRLAGHSRRKNGVIDAAGLRDERDVDWSDAAGLRLGVLAGLGDYVAITATVDVGRLDVGGPGTAFHCYDEAREDTGMSEVPHYPSPNVDCSGDHNAQFARDPYQTHLTHPHHPSGGYTDSEAYSLGAVWEMRSAELSASWSRFASDWHYDEEAPPHAVLARDLVERHDCLGALPAGYCTGGGPRQLPGNRYASQGDWGLRHDTTVRDALAVHLASTTAGRFRWALGAVRKTSGNAGGYHGRCPSSLPYHGLVEHCARAWLFHPDTPADVQGAVAEWLSNAVFPGNRTHVVNAEEAFFAKAAYRAGPFELALGARVAAIAIDHEVLAAGVNPDNAVQASFSGDRLRVSPEASLSWRPAGNSLIYAAAAHGFRPGVVNDGFVQVLADLEELRTADAGAEALHRELSERQVTEGDEAYGYELGVKVAATEGLNVTAAAYLVDWRDVAIDVSAATPDIDGLVPRTLDFADNVGSAESLGLEVELWGRLFGALDWALGASWMPKAEAGAAAEGTAPSLAATTTFDVVPGSRMPASPKTSGHASLAVDFRFGEIDGAARVDAYWVAPQWHSADNARVTPGHRTVDARLTLGRDRYRFGVYVRNLLDEVVVHGRNPVGYRFGRPRTVGLELSYSL